MVQNKWYKRKQFTWSPKEKFGQQRGPSNFLFGACTIYFRPPCITQKSTLLIKPQKYHHFLFRSWSKIPLRLHSNIKRKNTRGESVIDAYECVNFEKFVSCFPFLFNRETVHNLFFVSVKCSCCWARRLRSILQHVVPESSQSRV
jgi:hypothetical protein